MTDNNNPAELKANPLATESIPKLLAKFAVPSIISMVINAVYNIVDQIFLGNGIGFIGNTATNIAFPLVTFALAISLLISVGCSTFISLKLGEGNKNAAQAAFGNALALSAVCGIAFTVLALLFLDPLLILFGATETSLPYARDYASIVLLGVFFTNIYSAVNNTARADGNPRFAMICFASGAVLNAVLDPIFIFTFKMGVKGAAIATVIGHFVSFLIALSYLKKFRHFTFAKSDLKLMTPYTKTILYMGVSNFITQFSGVVVQAVQNNVLKTYGAMSVYGSDIPIAAFGIMMKINMILIGILLGISIGQQPIIGYNYGAKNYERVKKTYFIGVAVASAVAFIGWGVIMLFPEAIVSLFGKESPLFTEFAAKALKTYHMGICMAGFQLTSVHYFQAVGKSMIAAINTMARRIVILIPFVLILPKFYGMDGILYSGPITDVLALILCAVFVAVEMVRLNKLIAAQKEGIQL